MAIIRYLLSIFLVHIKSERSWCRLSNYFIFIFSILLLPTISTAFEWHIVPDKSSLYFKAIQNNAPIKGEFKTFTGQIDFDQQALNKSHVDIVVDTASVSTSFKDVSDGLKTAEWFDIKAFPKATFSAADFKKINDKDYEAQGKLTLRDKTLPLTLYFTFEKYTDKEAIVTGHAKLKRTEFGVGQGEWKKTDGVKDDVEINFKIEAIR